MASISERIQLHDGMSMPLFGLGCWALDEETTCNSVIAALKAGYRLIDTANYYMNESAVGRALKESGLKRDEYFVTTKLNLQQHGFEGAKDSLNESLRKLGLDYVDLFFIHTPMPGRVMDSWRGFMELKKEGKTKSIGVSNFSGGHIKALLDAGLDKPAVNQFEIHPMHRRDETVNFCRQHDIAVMGYCPLARGRILSDGDCPLLDELASKLNKSKAQVCLRWALQKNYITIPKSSSPAHIIENSKLYDFVISDEDMTRFEKLDDGMVISIACTPMSKSWDEIKNNDKPGQWV